MVCVLLSLDMIVESAWPACSKFLDRARTTYARLSRLESTIDPEQRTMRDEIARRLARFFCSSLGCGCTEERWKLHVYVL